MMKITRAVPAALLLSAACYGCLAAGIASMAPSVAMGTAQATSIASQPKGGAGIGPQEQAERCEELFTAAPGVEEVRKDAAGMIETRRWAIARRGGAPTWVIDRERGAPEDGWRPKPNIAKLNFKPEIYGLLRPDRPRYLAYAPANVAKPSDSAQFESMTELFGAGTGTFVWRGRRYSFVLAKELPCFKHEP